MTRRLSTGRGLAGDRGATAVEFALLLPIVLMMVFALIDFGRALNAQISLTQAAREGARLAALGDSTSDVTARTQAAAGNLGGTVTVTVTPCPVGGTQANDAVVQASYVFNYITPLGAFAGFFAGPITLTATGDMPCES